MSEVPTDREHFLGLVFLLRQMAGQLIEQKELAGARGLIDALGSLERKTKGNLDEDEEKTLSSVLYELRMAVVAGPPEGAGEGESGPESDPEPTDPEVGEKG